MNYDIRCDACGRFMRYFEEGSSWVFVPDSYVSREENRTRCRCCTEKFGAIEPNQNVRVDLCSGIVRKQNISHLEKRSSA